MSVLVVSAMLLLMTFASAISLSTVETTAQYDASYCQGKSDEMTSRVEQWATAWDTATIDPGGQIRAEGEQLSTEIGLTLVNCDTGLSDSDKVFLMQMQDVIEGSIENNIRYGPPCDPYCQPGPPIG